MINAGTVSANQVGGGVFPGGGAMAVSAGSGMAVIVAAGLCCVPNSTSALQGGYITGTMTSASLTLAAADASNYRIDLICVTVTDLGTASSNAVAQVVTGTPASSPSAPSLPGNSIALAQVLVPPGSSSVTSGQHHRRAGLRGRTGRRAADPLVVGGSGCARVAVVLRHRRRCGRAGLRVGGLDGPADTAAVAAGRVGPDQQRERLGGEGRADADHARLSITVDGSTDIEIYYKWTGLKASGSVPLLCTMQVSIDATVLDQAVISVPVHERLRRRRVRPLLHLGRAVHDAQRRARTRSRSAFQSASGSVTTTLSAASSRRPCCA